MSVPFAQDWALSSFSKMYKLWVPSRTWVQFTVLQQRFAPRWVFLAALESRRHKRNLSKSCPVCLELALEHSVWMPCSIARAQGVDEGSHVIQFLGHVVPQLFFSGRWPHDLYVNGLARSLPVAPQRPTFHIFGFWASQSPQTINPRNVS